MFPAGGVSCFGLKPDSDRLYFFLQLWLDGAEISWLDKYGTPEVVELVCQAPGLTIVDQIMMQLIRCLSGKGQARMENGICTNCLFFH